MQSLPFGRSTAPCCAPSDPNCDGSVIDPAKGQRIPDDAIWIDLEEPTREEDKLVEQLRRRPMSRRARTWREIEPSSRLYERERRALHDADGLYGVEDGKPQSDPIGFVLTDNRLVTVRYVDAEAVPRVRRACPARARRSSSDALTVLVRPARRDRRPAGRRARDRRAGDRDDFGPDLPASGSTPAAFPPTRLTALLTRIGRAQTLLAKIRETAVSTSRLLSFLRARDPMQDESSEPVRDHVGSLRRTSDALDRPQRASWPTTSPSCSMPRSA